jgi:hypothetical protein
MTGMISRMFRRTNYHVAVPILRPVAKLAE